MRIVKGPWRCKPNVKTRNGVGFYCTVFPVSEQERAFYGSTRRAIRQALY